MAIEWLSVLLLGSAPAPRQPRLLWIPPLVGLLIGAATRWIFPDVRGSGVNQTKAALYIRNGYISSKTVIGKFLLSALAIGGGHSLGPEDPSLQIGAGVASLISRRVGMSRARLRIFAPIGAAAGLAAAFNAPISAILFVIEEVIGQWSAAVLGSIVLSAVSAVVVARAFWGSEPIFRIPPINLRDIRELIAYAILGFVGGVASLFFAKFLGWLRPLLRSQPRTLQIFMPAMAGLIIGAIGYFGLPEVMGIGYTAIDQAMHAQFAWKMLLLLALFKIVATTLSFSSGSPGGMFAPTLFIGAMLGAAVGSVEKLYFPHLTGSIGAYALVGMGVLFAAFLRAPLTSVFMVLEMSGNYSIVLPVILANTIAYLLARALQPVPIFEVLTHQDGLNLPSMEEQREASDLHLEDALHPITVPILQGSEAVPDIRHALAQYNAQLTMQPSDIPILIHCLDGLWYSARRSDLDDLLSRSPVTSPEGALAGSAAQPPTLDSLLGPERTPILFPDLPLSSALPHFQRWPLLPITNRALRGSIEGAVTLEDVLRRFQQR